MSQTIGIGILGGGTVGGALAARLIDGGDEIEAKSGLRLELRKIAVRDLAKPRAFAAPELLTDDALGVVNDPSVDLIVETMGGLDPAHDLVLAALNAGKPVVTANKELVSAVGLQLIETAEKAGVALLFEAAVGGGIPIIRPLSQSLAGERISRVLGIVNGTTNYILSRMADASTPYEAALREAQQLGYAEPDPTADVSGADAAAKAAILASLAFGLWVRGESVYAEGIDDLDVEDVALAADLGYVIKLLAIAESVGSGVSVRVHTTLVPTDHPLASVRGAHNAIYIEGPEIDELLFSGPGAGGDPTATAVLGDVIDAGRELRAGAQVTPPVRFAPGQLVDFSDVATRWYIRLEVADEPGVLAQIASAFGNEGVSLASVWQEGRGNDATLLLVTHEALESSLRAARQAIEGLDVVRRVAARIRVHEPE